MARKTASRSGSKRKSNSSARSTGESVRQKSEAASEARSKSIRTVSERIGFLRDRGFQKIAGVKDHTLRSWLREESKPGFDALSAIVAATKCDSHWLLTGEGEPFPTTSSAETVAPILDESFANIVRASAALADAARVMSPQIGGTVTDQITRKDLDAAAKSLRDAAAVIQRHAGDVRGLMPPSSSDGDSE